MGEAGNASTRRPMTEVELVLPDAVAAANRIGGHADLHPVTAGERERCAQDVDDHRPLAGDRRLGLEAAKAADPPASEAKREAEASTDPTTERSDGEVTLIRRDRRDQRREPDGRSAEVAVAEQDQLRRQRVAQHRLRCRRDVCALAVRPPPTDDARARPHRYLGGSVARSVVGDPDRRRGEGVAQSANRQGNPIRLIARGDYHGQRSVRRGIRLGSRLLRRHAGIFSRAMDIEAHITGSVWKIEVAVGDKVEDGDTVVILESMKMEIPVESEDDGTVKEIRCEEGQSVSEGDVLVVLE